MSGYATARGLGRPISAAAQVLEGTAQGSQGLGSLSKTVRRSADRVAPVPRNACFYSMHPRPSTLGGPTTTMHHGCTQSVSPDMTGPWHWYPAREPGGSRGSKALRVHVAAGIDMSASTPFVHRLVVDVELTLRQKRGEAALQSRVPLPMRVRKLRRRYSTSRGTRPQP